MVEVEVEEVPEDVPSEEKAEGEEETKGVLMRVEEGDE